MELYLELFNLLDGPLHHADQGGRLGCLNCFSLNITNTFFHSADQRARDLPIYIRDGGIELIGGPLQICLVCWTEALGLLLSFVAFESVHIERPLALPHYLGRSHIQVEHPAAKFRKIGQICADLAMSFTVALLIRGLITLI
jgi:hypothetical protein